MFFKQKSYICIQKNEKYSLPDHSMRNLRANLLLFTSFSFMGDVAADLFPLGFTGVPSNRLAPVFVHTVTMETGESSVGLLLPWEHSVWGVLGGVSKGLAWGSSAFCCCSNNLICNVKGMSRRSNSLFYKEYEGAHQAQSWEIGGPCCEHLATLMFRLHATELTITSNDHINHHHHHHQHHHVPKW